MARVPPVDPERRFPFQGPLTAFATSRAGRWFGINVSARVDPLLMRLTRGRVSTFFGAPVVLITTTGRRSGQRRTVPVLYFTEGDDVVVIASSFGRARHPAWYHNLRASGKATLTARGRTGTYVADEVVDPDERLRLYRRGERLYSGWREYEAMAGAAGRQIAVFRLRPGDERHPARHSATRSRAASPHSG
ncbi:MAG TPA: nitroreductase family deazaflavin-dependent oxidoreductase [Solirubrobacteraceae bacterium]|jgi:deazaflavin-dependent oxidoreductase (nitroreductase family)|nr:nitroreductase family deazaflavin-dependent oxidoreductase [Solirubrobacteraceae bacterium]